jgi:UDP-N-acetyl-2-amino-2-deoxyglucuronate dehydrogenase
MEPRFVIIGCGKIAHRHAAQVKKIGRLIGVCDPNPDKLAIFSQQYNTTGYSDPLNMMENCDASVAIVCSPNYLHITHIKLALSRNLDVLCEKPICISTGETDDLDEFIKKSGKRLFIVLSARYHEQIINLKNQFSRKELGRLLSFQLNACWNRNPEYYQESDWKGRQGKDGGILLTQFSHYLDAMIWCLGDLEPISVKRVNFMHQDTIAGEDTGVSILTTADGAIGTLHWTVNSAIKNMEISLLVVCEKATLRLGGQYMEELEYIRMENRNEGWLRIKDETGQPEIPSGPRSHHDLVYAQLNLALQNKPHSLPGLAEGLKSVALIESIYAISQNHIPRSGYA